MSNYVRNFGVKNYQNRTTIPQLIASNMSGYFLNTVYRFLVRSKGCAGLHA